MGMRGGGVAHGRSVTKRGFRKGRGTLAAESARGNGSAGPRAVAGPEPVAVSAANGTAPEGREADLAATSAEMRVRTRPGMARIWSGSDWSRFVPTNWRVRWRLVAMVVVPAVTAAFLGGLTIDRDASGWLANGRVQNLAQLNVSVVRLSQALENERDLSAGYAANKTAVPGLAAQLRLAQAATASAGQAVRAGAAGIATAGGYQAAVVQDVSGLLGDLTQLQGASPGMSSSSPSALSSASKNVQLFAGQAIQAANTFSASVGNGTSDADLNGNVTALGALLRVENQLSVQRGTLFVALSSSPPNLTPAALTTLLQAQQQQAADQAEFTGSATQSELASFDGVIGGTAAIPARTQEALAVTNAVSDLPLTTLNNVSATKLTAPGWYAAMTATVNGTHQVAGQLAADVAGQASTLRSQSTSNLLVSSILTVLLLGLVVLVSTLVARSLIRPLRKLRVDALDIARRRLPEMVRQISEGVGESAEIEPIGVTGADEIGEVARAFDQVYQEAVRLAVHEATLRGNLNATFVNLSRRSQTLVERQLGIIDSLEQAEQDPERLSSVFRLDHLAVRMRRNSENLLVLAGHEEMRKWSKPVSLLDVVRAAISEIEEYDRVITNIQPTILISGRATSDVVRLIAELLENAATFSPVTTQVLVTGQTVTSGGVLIEIVDEGLGMADQDLERENWRLDNPPEIDAAASRQMGLFVVGRLAARHGVRVRLRHTPSSGVSVLVWLPETLMEVDASSSPGVLRSGRFVDPGAYQAASQVSSSPLPSPTTIPTVGVQPPVALVPSTGSGWFRSTDKSNGMVEDLPTAESWTSPADDGFRAARAVASPAVGETSSAGLPRRAPGANLLPGAVSQPAGQEADAQAARGGNQQQAATARRRSPEERRSRLTEFQRGAQQGRSDAPWNFGVEK
jgi:signal transduction histidine kinase